MIFEDADATGTRPRALMLMAYGQFNAEAYVAGPRPASPLLADERIVTLSSGVGLRGYKYDADGSKRLQGGEFFENGRRLRMEDVAEIHPMARHEIKNSSILHAAGARLAGGGGYDRIYVRASSKGGLRLVGKEHPANVVTGIYRTHSGEVSPILLSLIESARSFCRAAQENGEDLCRAFILFVHGEADRSTPAADYLQSFGEAKALIDHGLREAGISPYWLVTQAGGTDHRYGGNDWPCRLAAESFLAGDFDNLSFLGPLYPYPLDDAIHHDAEGKALIGELAGIAIGHIQNGTGWQTPRCDRWWLEGEKTVMIEIAAAEPLEVANDPDIEHLGFTLPPKSPNRIVAAEVIGDNLLRVSFDEPVKSTLRLGYAFRRGQPAIPPVDTRRPFGGGRLRTTWSERSQILPGRTLHKWLPDFMLQIRPTGR